MRNLDFSSWEGILSTLAGLVLITVIGVGIRLLAMHTIQQRRERENRQINERLRTLIAAYKPWVAPSPEILRLIPLICGICAAGLRLPTPARIRLPRA